MERINLGDECSMMKLLRNLMQKFEAENEPLKEAKKQLLTAALEKNLDYFKKSFDESADLTIRPIEILNTSAAIITMEGMINKEMFATSVMNPIVYAFSEESLSGEEKFAYIKNNILTISEVIDVTTFEDAFKLVMSGFALLLFDDCTKALAIGVQGFNFRSIAEPETEVMQKGSKEGFVEAVRINLTLVRRRIKNPKLKFEFLAVGETSQTDICLCYIKDAVSSKILAELKRRLARVNLKNVLAAEYLIPYLEEPGDLSLFSGVGFSERPDTVCGKIAEGRIAILVDGTPTALIVPYLFIEYFQTIDDYAERPYFATLTRWLKYFAFFISTLLPGLYVALAVFNPEVFPDRLITKIASAIAGTPFPLMLETLIIHFIYEIMREAGLRLPRPLGHAVSIVGGLVIGETAVNAGLIGAPTLMVVALTAISSYVIPNLYEPTAILRLIFIIVGGILGIWGVMLLFSVLIVNICAKSSFGVPFVAPIAPFNFHSLRDVVTRAGWKTLSKKSKKIQNMPH